jgi:hypothetical protein
LRMPYRRFWLVMQVMRPRVHYQRYHGSNYNNLTTKDTYIHTHIHTETLPNDATALLPCRRLVRQKSPHYLPRKTSLALRLLYRALQTRTVVHFCK